MSRKSVRRSLAMTPQMAQRLNQIASTKPRNVTEADLIRETIILAWIWVVSPAPDLMVLVPEHRRRDFVCDLTERVVEDYYTERGFDLPEYSYILHDRPTDDAGLQQLHTHG